MSNFTRNDVDIKRVTRAYDGFLKIDVLELKHKLFAGGWSRVFTRELLERGHAVAVLPYDPVREEFVFIEQFRVGALATSDEPWLLEIVAGVIDPGETAEDVAHREAEEEAGIEIKHLVKLTDYLPSPGGTSERIYLYLGIVNSEEAGGVHGLEYENEDIRVKCLSVDETMELLQNGAFQNSATIIGLQQFYLFKEQLLESVNPS
ncbi:MAG: NUDIX domain-containing protein [Alteromonadaceae bacterium]|nr:NUDIX domain-containing protein [Alteromonadaceae bacterium]